jgi:alcohol dehydrogenase (cytochrome c)
MYWANRNGLFYALERTSGQFLMGKPFVSFEGTLIYAGVQGGTNWYSPSFSPGTGLFYIPTWAEYSSNYVKAVEEYKEGNQYTAGIPRSPVPFGRSAQNYRKEEEGYGAIRAIDPKTGERKWEFKMSDVTEGGILTTATDLLFSGGREGYFFALDARKGALLWKANLGGAIAAGPISYSAGGRQYIAISAGNSLFTFALRQ